MCDPATRGFAKGPPAVWGVWLLYFRRVRSISLACIFAWGFSGAAAAAQEVFLPHGPLSLSATLEVAPGKSLADGVVLMLHGALAHKDMRVMREFRTMFADNGFNTLAISLSLGLDRRSDMYDCAQPHVHVAADAIDEIGVWLEWLAGQGVPRATVLGFSRGGHQVAWFAAERSHPLVDSYVLLAPAIVTDTADAERYEARHGVTLDPVLERAHELVRTGQDSTRLKGVAFMHCAETDVSAASFLSYYAPDPATDTPALLERIQTPTLVLVAGLDEIVQDGERRLGTALNNDRVQLKVIAGADHFFHDLFGEDAMDAIIAFLR